jgi:Zn finger protein HypA/HybF involved in hydrogenase expression
MANGTVEKILREGLGLKDDILEPRWCANCHIMVFDELPRVRCPGCGSEKFVGVDVTVVEGKVVFRKRS